MVSLNLNEIEKIATSAARAYGPVDKIDVTHSMSSYMVHLRIRWRNMTVAGKEELRIGIPMNIFYSIDDPVQIIRRELENHLGPVGMTFGRNLYRDAAAVAAMAYTNPTTPMPLPTIPAYPHEPKSWLGFSWQVRNNSTIEHPDKLLEARLRVTPRFDHGTLYLSTDKVFVFYVKDGVGSVIEDPIELFPSDALVAALRLVIGNNPEG